MADHLASPAWFDANVELPRGTVTFLLTDVVGSVALWEARPDAAAAAMERHEAVVAAAARDHGGVLVKSRGEGDSTFSVFSRATDAIAAAAAVRAALPTELPELGVRCAVHTGEADPRDGDYIGIAPSRCARLRDLAHGGQVLVSDVTAALLGHAGLIDLGSHRLRGFAAAERVFQLGGEQFPPLRSGRGNLTVPLTSFVGRGRELESLEQLIAEQRLVTLTGPGGCGKSRLALEAARGLEALDGAWLVDLAPLGSESLVAATIATTLGAHESPGVSALDAAVRLLRDRDAVVVLDNCEHLVDACARAAERIVHECPNVRIVATSREPLGVPGERVWRIPPMTVDDAVALFVARATPGTDRSSAVDEICSRLDGMPLAIELAAARTSMLTPASILDGLDDRFRLLTGGARGSMSRQKTLEASVEWSWSLLTDTERTALRRVAVFVGGFTLDGAAAVAGEDDVLGVVSRLVDRSLVVSDGSGRFHLLDTIRHYALGKLIESGEIDDIRTRHRDFFAMMLDRPRSLDERCTRTFIDRIALEDQNLLAAIDWCHSLDEPETALRVLVSAWSGVDTRPLFGEAGELVRHTLDLAPDAPPDVRALALTALTTMILQARGPSDAVPVGQMAVETAVASTSDELEALARSRLAFALLYRDVVAARTEVEQAEELAHGSGSSAALVAAQYVRGIVAYEWGSPGEGVDLLEHALDVARRTDNYCAPFVMTRLTAAHGLAGRLEDAWSAAEAVLAGDDVLPGMDAVMGPLGFVAVDYARGDFDAALARLDDAEPELRAKSPWTIPVATWFRGQIALRTGQPERALELLNEVVAAGAISLWLPIEARVELARVMSLSDRDAEARSLLADAIRTARGVGHPRSLVRGLRELAQLELTAGNLDRGETLAAEAVERSASLGLRRQLIESLLTYGALRIERGDLDTGARLVAAAEADRDRMGLWLGPVDAPRLTDDLALVRASPAFVEGSALTPDEAAAYALRGRGRRTRTKVGWDSLTPSELDVVRLAADGLTNPEIGERLFISPRTVQSHLSSVFAKLGIRTRTELAAQMAKRSR